jgi:hypothetical protein
MIDYLTVRKAMSRFNREIREISNKRNELKIGIEGHLCEMERQTIYSLCMDHNLDYSCEFIYDETILTFKDRI